MTAVVLADDDGLLRLFEETAAVHDNPRGAANWVYPLARPRAEGHGETGDLPVSGAQLGEPPGADR